MRTRSGSLLLILIFFGMLCTEALIAQSPEKARTVLERSYNFGGERKSGKQSFVVTSTFVQIGPDGTPYSRDTYTLFINRAITAEQGKRVERFTCTRFALSIGESLHVTIPALEGWSYVGGGEAGKDAPLLGIEHAKFEKLLDNNGNAIEADKSYLVYNTFIDFHSFCDVLGRPTTGGNGIQNLHRIGDRIVHSAAYSQPSVSLGKNVAEGSFFKNGEITLEFKGLGRITGRTCALIGFDSGESSFNMTLTPAPEMTIATKGGSHYFGELYIDTKTLWIRKVVLQEIVVSQTHLPFPPGVANTVTERISVITDTQ